MSFVGFSPPSRHGTMLKIELNLISTKRIFFTEHSKAEKTSFTKKKRKIYDFSVSTTILETFRKRAKKKEVTEEIARMEKDEVARLTYHLATQLSLQPTDAGKRRDRKGTKLSLSSEQEQQLADAFSPQRDADEVLVTKFNISIHR